MFLTGAWCDLEEMRQHLPHVFRGQLSKARVCYNWWLICFLLQFAHCMMRREEQSPLCPYPGIWRPERWYCCHSTNLPPGALCSALTAPLCPSLLFRTFPPVLSLSICLGGYHLFSPCFLQL